MRKAGWLLLLLPVVPVFMLVSGCRKPDYTYSTNGIYLKNYDNSGNYILESTGPINRSAYVMRIFYESTYTNFYSVNDDNTYEGLNKPVSIDIRCLQNFDSLHPANASMNDCFINGPGITSSIEDVITQFPNTKDYYPTHEPDDLWLMKAPTNTGNYSFVVTMSFDDGITVADTTVVTLN